MIHIHHVSKKFASLNVLQNISLSINDGEIFGIVGASGAGKSTLLRLINLLEKPDQGHITVHDQQLETLPNKQLRAARKSIGMIFQSFNLILNKTVYQNIETALHLAHYPKQERASRIMECLQFVGLADYVHTYPATLSGGQKQRVAIARALANKPRILLCDEPTSALDPSTTNEILKVLDMVNKQLGVTIVLVSHEMHVIKSICTRVAILENGQLYDTLSITPAGIPSTDMTAQQFVQALVGDKA